ncbi:hypothetical protein [Pseudomonas sp. GXZC]|uniref:hypothetical protein n=1 Tax=Pseudomonas sp. GXZC TaxID=3003351 RepID=UPI0022AA0CC1|nr:hypothetical protein [Pseudomonas sp. GXZC]WAT32135.1 hypothetical protein OZ428_34300 [Pseudomonas sp. GXZC]
MTSKPDIVRGQSNTWTRGGQAKSSDVAATMEKLLASQGTASVMLFSMRAECLVDFNRFFELVKPEGLILEYTMHPDADGFPDVEIEFTSDSTLGKLSDAIRRVPDGHTMLQTLRPMPLAENSMERDYDIR